MLQPNGTCVTFGASEASAISIESWDFFAVRATLLCGLTLFHELMSVERAGIGLGLLADLITAKKLRPQIAGIEVEIGGERLCTLAGEEHRRRLAVAPTRATRTCLLPLQLWLLRAFGVNVG